MDLIKTISIAAAGMRVQGQRMQIKQNSNRAANLVRQLLAFSRRQTHQPKVLVLSDVLAELSNLLWRLLGEKIELKLVLGRDVGLVKVDQGQFEQVIINLAVNARDAMPEGGTLTIKTRKSVVGPDTHTGQESLPPGDYVLVEVIDEGTGIPDEILDKIFEPFFTTKEVGRGSAWVYRPFTAFSNRPVAPLFRRASPTKARPSASIFPAMFARKMTQFPLPALSGPIRMI